MSSRYTHLVVLNSALLLQTLAFVAVIDHL
jgi:hypothetical protein